MRPLYDLFVRGYGLGARLAAIRSPKAQRWVEGRAHLFDELEAWRASQPGPLIWMHAASAGEWEQGRPVAEALKEAYPDHRLLLTFFSPSGLEGARRRGEADGVMYLPLDTAGNAARFLSIVQPALVIFIKYEYWQHHLRAVQKARIPLLLISAIFRPAAPFFKPWGGYWRSLLKGYSRLFVQDTASQALLARIGLRQVTVAGDTRFDRVAAVADRGADVPHLEGFGKEGPVLVAGSTWPEDEAALGRYFKGEPRARLLLAPHEVNRKHLAQMGSLLPPFIPYSQLDTPYFGRSAPTSGAEGPSRIIVVDSTGLLSRLYRHGQVAYVGGGFNKSGIHNILEAAVYGLPVVFGPQYGKFKEARDLLALGGAFTYSHPDELPQLLDRLLFNQEERARAGAAAGRYVQDNRGATATILRYIEENRLLTRP